MKRITFRDRLRYQFDNVISRGTIALIGLLFVVTLTLILILWLVLVVTHTTPLHADNTPMSWGEIAWATVMQTLNSSPIVGDLTNTPFLLSLLAATLGGIFIVGALIGILTNAVAQKFDQLREGRSMVAEIGHTIILGWSSNIFSLISELVVANANQRHARIAILAEKDKVEMENEIRDKVRHTGTTRVVCRTGNPIDLTDLEIVNPHAARAIIVLAPEIDDPDSHTIKTILALTNNPDRRRAPYHIVAEIHEPKNMDVARMVGRDEAQFVLAGDLIARIAVQTLRQSGLSVVYSELLDFEGDEIYFQEEPQLIGKTFGEALLAYEDSAVIGLRTKEGGVKLNPPMDTRLAAGDEIIAVSEDDDTVRLSKLTDYHTDTSAIRQAAPRPRAPTRTLLLGWNRWATTIVNQLDNFVAPASELVVVANDPDAENEIAQECSGLTRQTISYHPGETTDRRTLDDLAIPTFHHVMVLSYSDLFPPQQADARTLITLLHLRDIAERTDHPFAIVSEMLDVRNRELAEVTQADDFIISNRLVSLMLSQIAENRELAAVFADLFSPEGSELYIKPASDYVEYERPINFYTVVEAARRRGEVAIGYRRHAERSNPRREYGVVVNPDKSNLITFTHGDKIIVLAES